MSGYKNLDDLKKSIHAQMEILTIQEKYVATLEENMKGGDAYGLTWIMLCIYENSLNKGITK